MMTCVIKSSTLWGHLLGIISLLDSHYIEGRIGPPQVRSGCGIYHAAIGAALATYWMDQGNER